MIKYLIIFLPIFFILLFGSFFLAIKKLKPDYEILKIEINEKVFETEISDTLLKRAKGLSGRKTIDENKGMLFIFEKSGIYNFWMAGMNFPIDIIWIKENQIVDISKNIQPPKNTELPKVIYPSGQVDKVLEILAGGAEKFNIKIGDKIKILE